MPWPALPECEYVCTVLVVEGGSLDRLTRLLVEMSVLVCFHLREAQHCILALPEAENDGDLHMTFNGKTSLIFHF